MLVSSKEILDKHIIGMPDDDNMKRFILAAMEEYAKLYHIEKECEKLHHMKKIADISTNIIKKDLLNKNTFGNEKL